MCERYRLSRRKQIVEEYFASVSGEEEDWSPRYNIAPNSVRASHSPESEGPGPELVASPVGLIPSKTPLSRRG
jgi:putative SOS response-associated peptidase YedK